MSAILEKLRRINALAESGVGGERHTAERLLRELCTKHGVRIEDLKEGTRNPYKFTISDIHERQIFHNCVAHCIHRDDIAGKVSGQRAVLYLTPSEAVQFGECWHHYRGEWRDQLKTLAIGFIQKHRIF